MHKTTLELWSQAANNTLLPCITFHRIGFKNLKIASELLAFEFSRWFVHDWIEGQYVWIIKSYIVGKNNSWLRRTVDTTFYGTTRTYIRITFEERVAKGSERFNEATEKLNETVVKPKKVGTQSSLENRRGRNVKIK